MAAARQDIVIERGATFKLPLRLRDSNGALLQMADCVARMQVRQRLDSDEVALDLNTDNGGITLDNEGLIAIKATAQATDALTILKGVYDLELEWPNGDVDRLFEGRVTVKASVTR